MSQQVLQLHDVFVLSGIPQHTFVQPVEYTRLLVALKTPGRGVVIEGPSGIGKTSCGDHQGCAEFSGARYSHNRSMLGNTSDWSPQRGSPKLSWEAMAAIRTCSAASPLKTPCGTGLPNRRTLRDTDNGGDSRGVIRD
jgi:hypothetical protein